MAQALTLENGDGEKNGKSIKSYKKHTRSHSMPSQHIGKQSHQNTRKRQEYDKTQVSFFQFYNAVCAVVIS